MEQFIAESTHKPLVFVIVSISAQVILPVLISNLAGHSDLKNLVTPDCTLYPDPHNEVQTMWYCSSLATPWKDERRSKAPKGIMGND
jgi:hypothetical protein